MSRTLYQEYMDLAIPGAIKGIGRDYAITAKAYRNGNPGEKEQWEIAVPATVDADSVYEIMVGTTMVGFKTGSSSTQSDLQQGLLRAYQSNPIANTLFEITVDGNSLMLMAHEYDMSQNVLVKSSNTNSLSVSKTQSSQIPGGINFGRLVAVGDEYNSVRYANAAGDRIIGATLAVYDTERNGRGSNGVNSFEYGGLVDVLERCNKADGIWIETNDPTIVPGDSIFASTNNDGFVVKNSGIDLSAIASFQSQTKQVMNGKQIVLVRFNLP